MQDKSVLPKKPQIFFIIPSLMCGGAERVIISLANHFGKLNYKPVIISINYCEPAYTIDVNIKVIYLLKRNKEKLINRGYYILLIFFKLLMLLKKEKPICSLSFITSANIWNGITCSITKIPYLVSERTSPDRSINQLGYFFNHLTALLYKRSSAIVVSAKGVENCLRKNILYKNFNNIYKISNAVPLFKAVSVTNVHHRKFVLGVGRLEYVKGFDLLITAFKNASLIDTDLLIIGDGNENTNLLQQANSLNIGGSVKLLGFKSNLQDYYSQADIFVLPSRNEGYPNALLEAMSFGCACIAMDCDFGPSEIISNNINGLLIPFSKPKGLENAIAQLSSDLNLKARLKKQAMEINNTNNENHILKEWENLLLNRI